MTVKEEIEACWDISWRNHHAPYQMYHFSYYLRSRPEAWSEFTSLLSELDTDRFILLSDSQSSRSWATKVAEQLVCRAPCTFLPLEGPKQEASLETVAALGEAVAQAGGSRSSVVVALGGDLAGNIGGLLAGLLYQGIRFIYLPTTLLAMIDSTLSLKKSVSSNNGRNHFGMFYAPSFVWSYLPFLQTLPPREIQSALCELIKNVVVLQPHLIDELAVTLHPAAHYTHSQLARFIALCVDLKSSVLVDDALEQREALALMYGHCIGRALERAYPGTLPHGQAIGLGMVVEAQIAHLRGLLPTPDVAAHYRLLRANGVPTAIPANFDRETIMEMLRQNRAGGYTPKKEGYFDMILLKRLGEPSRTNKTILTQVEEQEVLRALQRCQIA